MDTNYIQPEIITKVQDIPYQTNLKTEKTHFILILYIIVPVVVLYFTLFQGPREISVFEENMSLTRPLEFALHSIVRNCLLYTSDAADE